MLLEGCDREKGGILFLGHRIPMKNILNDIESFAAGLRSRGFVRGDVLTIYLPTCPQAVVAFYACSKLGVIANIVHPLTSAEKLREIADAVHSKGLMYYDLLAGDGRCFSDMGQILIRCSVSDYVVVRRGLFLLYAKLRFGKGRGISYRRWIGGESTETEGAAEGRSEDVVCTMHSGGTSGEPKIVRLQNKAFNHLSASLEQMYTRKVRGRGKEYALAALPIFHAYGLGVAIHTCLTNGYSLILMPQFKPKKINAEIRRRNVTFFVGVPVMFRKMIRYKNFYGEHLAKLRDLWCGGDVLEEAFVEYFDTILKKYGCPARLFRGYGLTEVCGVCAANTFENYRAQSCGKAIPNTRIEIWDESDNALPARQLGEIVISSESVMEGYQDSAGTVEKEGRKWVRSGDYGWLDPDGFLYMVDRKKRSVKINGMNVFPSEIEKIAKARPEVSDACAVSYHYKQKVYFKLYLTLSAPLDAHREEALKRELKEECRNKLIRYAVPYEIEILDEMPRTAFGKIDFRRLETK